MPIKNLTDRDTLQPRLARLGKLRKGGEKKNPKKPGADLDHFRADMNDSEVQRAFMDAYGDQPRMINLVLFYDTLERNFSTWIEAWDASGLVMRSDGEYWRVWREGDAYKRGKKPHQDVEGQQIVGRFEFIIPELLQSGFVGTVTLETHSNHDLRNIASVLLAAEQERGTLRGAQFVMRRVQEEISVPGWGDRKGQRSTAKKWLVKIEPPRQMFGAMLEAPQHTRALTVDDNTGEIIEGTVEAVAQAIEAESSKPLLGAVDEVDPGDDEPKPNPRSNNGNGTPDWLRTETWYGFAESVVSNMDEFSAVAHVTNTLKAEIGDDYTPWAEWAPDTAEKCYNTLKQHLANK